MSATPAASLMGSPVDGGGRVRNGSYILNATRGVLSACRDGRQLPVRPEILCRDSAGPGSPLGFATVEIDDEWGERKQGTEALDAWETSSGGPIGHGEVHFEAMKIGDDEAWAIAHLQ